MMHRNENRYMYTKVELQKRSVEEDCNITTEYCCLARILKL